MKKQEANAFAAALLFMFQKLVKDELTNTPHNNDVIDHLTEVFKFSLTFFHQAMSVNYSDSSGYYFVGITLIDFT